MAEPVRIVGHKTDTENCEGLQAQVMPNGALLVWEEGYVLSDVDESATDYYYYGYLDRTGAWYIMRKTLGTSTAAFRYTAGTSSYSLAWTNKVSQTYDYWNATF